MDENTRRKFLAALAVTGAGAGLASRAGWAAGAIDAGTATVSPKEVEEVAPAEDLMREHGVLNRILLIYDEALRRLDARADPAAGVLHAAAGIVQRFIEAYHERLEEEHLFPRFEKAGRLVDLVRTLRDQHQAGRAVTTRILDLTVAGGLKDAEARRGLAEQLRRFNRMYRPHEAREDTVLFPALHDLLSAADYDRLGEQFEDREHELFGARGFEGIVDQVAELERTLAIYDLAQFTPR
jgi:hemerythrin-like domain-containing protein